MSKIKTVFLIIAVLSYNSRSFAQAIDQAALDKSIQKGNATITKSLDDLSTVIKASVKPVNPFIQTIKADNTTSVIIAFLPIALFILIILVILIKSNKNGITLREILLDKDMQLNIKKEEAKVEVAKATEATAKSITAQAAASQAQVPVQGALPTPFIIQQPPPQTDTSLKDENSQQSVSRLIALISGITSVALAACIATFYMYRWSLGDNNMDIGHLSSILYGLGLGVIPYGVNKVASVLRG